MKVRQRALIPELEPSRVLRNAKKEVFELQISIRKSLSARGVSSKGVKDFELLKLLMEAIPDSPFIDDLRWGLILTRFSDDIPEDMQTRVGFRKSSGSLAPFERETKYRRSLITLQSYKDKGMMFS